VTWVSDASAGLTEVTPTIARDLRVHPVVPNPKRQTRRASFDDLGGNTTLGVLLTEFGDERVGHRHLDEATTFIVAGHGWTEVRPHPEGPASKVNWTAGDLFAIPSNAWHRHHGSSEPAARQLTFKSTPLMNRLFNSRAFIRENEFEFSDRYGDSGTWDHAVRLPSWGGTKADRASKLLSLPEAPHLGRDVRAARLSLAGQRLLEAWLLELPTGNSMTRHRHLTESAAVVLDGEGRTTLWKEDGSQQFIDWRQGDLISPPIGLDYAHASESPKALMLVVRCAFLEAAIGVERTRRLESRLRASTA
jgi:gentisate 1,2-dioxygenase